MKLRSRLAVLAVGLPVIAAAGIGVLAIAPVLTNPHVSAEELLAAAESESRKVERCRFNIVAMQAEGTTIVATSTQAVVIKGKGFHVINLVEGIPPSEGGYQETLLVQGREYSRTHPDGEWTSTESRFDPDTAPTLSQDSYLRVLDDLSHSEVVGEEEIDGVPSRKIRGNVDLAAKAEEIWGADPSERGIKHREQFVSGSQQIVIWVGKEDSIIRAYEVTSEFPGLEDLPANNSRYRVVISDFDAALQLPNP